jgi:hypothetical protein
MLTKINKMHQSMTEKCIALEWVPALRTSFSNIAKGKNENKLGRLIILKIVTEVNKMH